jgi:hypothetical protein
MLERLRSWSASEVDINFYLHELKESSLMNQDVAAHEAHRQSLEWQGIHYQPGYESQLSRPT